MTIKAKSKQPQRLKRPRGALLRAINAGLISTDEAHQRGYMGKAELSGCSRPTAQTRTQ